MPAISQSLRRQVRFLRVCLFLALPLVLFTSSCKEQPKYVPAVTNYTLSCNPAELPIDFDDPKIDLRRDKVVCEGYDIKWSHARNGVPEDDFTVDFSGDNDPNPFNPPQSSIDSASGVAKSNTIVLPHGSKFASYKYSIKIKSTGVVYPNVHVIVLGK